MRGALTTLGWLAVVAGGLVAQPAEERSPLLSFRCRRTIFRGLDSLARTQKPDGSWPTSRSHDAVYDTAVCGLALLAEGSTTREGRFREALARATDFLVDRIPSSGPLRVARSTGEDYEHFETWYAAFAALFLTEAYSKDRSPEVQSVLAALARRLTHLQRETGGWCHDLRSRMTRSGWYEYAWYSEDLAVVSGYAVAALAALRRAGVTIPPATLERARHYFERIHNHEGNGGYQYGLLHSWNRAVESEPGRTAAVIFGLTWLEDAPSQRIESAARYLEKNLADIPISAGHAGNVFSLNYLSGALACRRLGRGFWQKYVEHFVPRLLALRQPGGVIKLGRSHHDKEPMNTALALIVLQLANNHLGFASPRKTPLESTPPVLPSAEVVAFKGIAYLLDHQRPDGSWLADPSYLDPRGKLMVAPPMNIFTDDAMAVTALAGRALLRFPGLEPDRRGPAIERAVAFLARTMTAQRDRYLTAECSPIWQAYALDFLLDVAASATASGRDDARKEAETLVRRVIECVAAGECKGGGWTYTYYDSSRGTPRTFCTALVVRSLLAAKAGGFAVPEAKIERGRSRLDQAGLEDGGYRYLYYRPDWPARVTPMGSVGRMALIEGARLQAGSGSVEELERAVTLFFKHRALLDAAIRSQTRHGNEGCHHFFAYYHLAEALGRLPPKTAAPFRAQVVRHLRARCRADGSWWDSRRAGPSAATALALLALDLVGADPVRERD